MAGISGFGVSPATIRRMDLGICSPIILFPNTFNTSGGATYSLVNLTAAQHFGYCLKATNNQNKTTTIKVGLSIGTYRMRIMTFENTASGIFNVDITSTDGTQTFSPTGLQGVSLYFNPIRNNYFVEGTSDIVITSSSLFNINFVNAGKDGASSDYDFMFTYIELYRTA